MAKQTTTTVKVKAAPHLNGVSFHEDIGLTVEQYNELKYGSGEAEITPQAAEWLSKHNHIQIIKEGE